MSKIKSGRQVPQDKHRSDTASLLAIDPGLSSPGIALFDFDGYLLNATALKNPARGHRNAAAWDLIAQEVIDWLHMLDDMPGGLFEVVYEQMVARNDAHTKGADLLQLAGVSGAIISALNQRADVYRATAYKPEHWKGQMGKLATQRRVDKRLSRGTDAEQALAETLKSLPSSRRDDAFDAVGLGLVHLGRMRR